MRRAIWALLAFFVVFIVAGYLSSGDAITTLKFRGVEYFGSGTGGYEITATDLTPIGNAESMNFPHTESTVYELGGVDTTQVVVAYEGSNRALSMFFKAELFRHQSPESSGVDVLSLIPGLCRYWVGSSPSACDASPE
jgi:hypothetical protein